MACEPEKLLSSKNHMIRLFYYIFCVCSVELNERAKRKHAVCLLFVVVAAAAAVDSYTVHIADSRAYLASSFFFFSLSGRVLYSEKHMCVVVVTFFFLIFIHSLNGHQRSTCILHRMFGLCVCVSWKKHKCRPDT